MPKPAYKPWTTPVVGLFSACASTPPAAGICPRPPITPAALQNLPEKGTGQARLDSYLSRAVTLLEHLPPSGTTP